MKGDKMRVIASVTSVGQVTIPKAWRDALGITGRVVLDKRDERIIIELDEGFDAKMSNIRKKFSSKTRRLVKKNAGKTAAELRQEILETKDGKKYMEEQYGV